LQLQGPLEVEHAPIELIVVILETAGMGFLDTIYVLFLIFNHKFLQRNWDYLDSRQFWTPEKESADWDNIVYIHLRVELDKLLLDTGL
jgi:hypothetical protein